MDRLNTKKRVKLNTTHRRRYGHGHGHGSEMNLTILITYCSNERMFADALLKAALHAADIVCVAVGRRLFDGRDEDVNHIMDLANRYPRAHFVWFEVPDELLPTPIVLHNNARIAARDLASDLSKGQLYTDSWVIMLDGDEVPREGGCPLLDWWRTVRAHAERQNTYKLSNRWFFLHPRLISERIEDSVVLVHGSNLSDRALSHPRERDGVCMTVCQGGGNCVRNVGGVDATPMFDHFSWVRESRDHLIKKVVNWGHTNDQDWVTMINKAFDDMEQGVLPERDFVHGGKLILLDE